MKFFVACLVFCALVSLGHCHVSLTFPPARMPDYDFLDNVRTGGPCGVPGIYFNANSYYNSRILPAPFLDLGSSSVVTTFATGTEFNATFHLAYPHRVSNQCSMQIIRCIYTNCIIIVAMLLSLLVCFSQGGVLVNILHVNGSLIEALYSNWTQLNDST